MKSTGAPKPPAPSLKGRRSPARKELAAELLKSADHTPRDLHCGTAPCDPPRQSQSLPGSGASPSAANGKLRRWSGCLRARDRKTTDCNQLHDGFDEIGR